MSKSLTQYLQTQLTILNLPTNQVSPVGLLSLVTDNTIVSSAMIHVTSWKASSKTIKSHETIMMCQFWLSCWPRNSAFIGSFYTKQNVTVWTSISYDWIEEKQHQTSQCYERWCVHLLMYVLKCIGTEVRSQRLEIGWSNHIVSGSWTEQNV